MSASAHGKTVFKIDRFRVPAVARNEFMERVRSIRDFLDAQDGCGQNLVLERAGDPDSSFVVTIVEWRDDEAFAKARAAAAARYAATGFSPQALIERLGIVAEIGDYGLVA
ncbi:MAG: antibiotic biosynthesis monooxygenase [Devosia sp.]|nr:antibiotic biosynthesis monooxygenase [Devosia sp.]